MATAEELLRSTLKSVPTHDHIVGDPDTYFVIDPVSRKITNVSLTTNVLMQNDHDSERFTFELPRYVEEHDMMLCNRVRVHYNNYSEESGIDYEDVYESTDLKINPDNPDTVICTWLVSRNATQQAGVLSFLVQYLCMEGDTPVYEWHSDIYSDVEVKLGRNNSEAALLRYTDLIEQWKQDLFGAGDSSLAKIEAATETVKDEIEAKGEETLATIPEDYTETYNMANTALRTRAEAVDLTVSGESIILDDASDSYILDLKVYGRSEQISSTGAQLLPINDLGTKTDRGLHQTIQGGVCTVRGTTATSAAFNLTLCGSYFETTPILTLTPGTYTVKDCMIVSYDGTKQTKYQDTTFTLIENLDVTWVATRSYAVDEVVNEITYPMLNQGNMALPWEPYTEGKASPSPECPQEITSVINPSVSIYGGNLANVKGLELSANKSLTISDDGYTITATGGGNKAYVSSPTTLDINILRGKFVYFRADSIVSNIAAAKASAQLNIRVPTGTIYVAVNDSDLGKEVYIPDDAVALTMAIYTNNTGVALGDDCTVTVHGLGLYLVDIPWDKDRGVQKLTINRELRGIPVTANGNYTDSNGQQWICDEIDFERGKYIQRVGSRTYDGSSDEGWHLDKVLDINIMFRIEIPDSVNVGNVVGKDFVCSQYKPGAIYQINKVGAQHTMKQFYFNLRKSSLTTEDIAGFRTFLQSNPFTIHYVLATPIETDLTSVEMQAFGALHTNATNTTILNDKNATMSVKYVADIEKYIYKNVTYKVRKFDLTLPKDNWVESSDKMYYSQTVNFTARPTGKIELHPTAAQLIGLINDGISMFVGNENGVVTAYSIGGVPDIDFTIQATEEVVVYV